MALNQSQLESTVHRAFFNPQSNPNAVRPYSQEFFFKESDGCIRLLYFSEQYMSSRQPPQPSRWPSWPPTPAEVAATAVPSGAVAMAAFVAEEGCCHNCNCCCDAGFSLHIGNCSLCDSQKCHHEERYHPFIHSFSRWVGRSLVSLPRHEIVNCELQFTCNRWTAPNRRQIMSCFLLLMQPLRRKRFFFKKLFWKSNCWTSEIVEHPCFGRLKQTYTQLDRSQVSRWSLVFRRRSRNTPQIFFLVWRPVFRCPEMYQKSPPRFSSSFGVRCSGVPKTTKKSLSGLWSHNFCVRAFFFGNSL